MNHAEIMRDVRGMFDERIAQDREAAFHWALQHLNMEWPNNLDVIMTGTVFKGPVYNWRLIRSLNADMTDGPCVLANMVVRGITEQEVRNFLAHGTH